LSFNFLQVIFVIMQTKMRYSKLLKMKIQRMRSFCHL